MEYITQEEQDELLDNQHELELEMRTLKEKYDEISIKLSNSEVITDFNQSKDQVDIEFYDGKLSLRANHYNWQEGKNTYSLIKDVNLLTLVLYDSDDDIAVKKFLNINKMKELRDYLSHKIDFIEGDD
jgi:molybdopterin-guanine dinucleotide biosynthesis protein A